MTGMSSARMMWRSTTRHQSRQTLLLVNSPIPISSLTTKVKTLTQSREIIRTGFNGLHKLPPPLDSYTTLCWWHDAPACVTDVMSLKCNTCDELVPSDVRERVLIPGHRSAAPLPYQRRGHRSAMSLPTLAYDPGFSNVRAWSCRPAKPAARRAPVD